MYPNILENPNNRYFIDSYTLHYKSMDKEDRFNEQNVGLCTIIRKQLFYLQTEMCDYFT